MTTINPCPVCGKEGFHHATGSGGESVVSTALFCGRYLNGYVRCRLPDGHDGPHDFHHKWEPEFPHTDSCKLCGESSASEVHTQNKD